MGSASILRVEHCRKRWDNRVLRARELQKNYATAAVPLRFYAFLLESQRDIAAEIRLVADPGVPIRQQIDTGLAASKMSRLLAVISQHGPDAARMQAQELCRSGESSWLRIVQTELVSGGPDLSAFEDLVARACLQPIAENLQSQLLPQSNYSQSVCPACGGLAQLAILRPEGEGASRSLLCSFCLREWLFRRIICPYCGEEDKEKLPRYSTHEYAHVHVEACDTCKRYLKAVDLSLDGFAVPIVDEAAVAVLDVWAFDHDYTKIMRNLIGL